MTRTGQWACVTQYSLTEPRSIPANSPCPRLPTTSRGHAFGCLGKDRGRVSLNDLTRHGQVGPLGHDFDEGFLEDVFRVTFRIESGEDRCVPTGAPVPIPDDDDLHRLARHGRVSGSPPQRSDRSGRSVNADHDFLARVFEVRARHSPFPSRQPLSGEGRISNGTDPLAEFTTDDRHDSAGRRSHPLPDASGSLP